MSTQAGKKEEITGSKRFTVEYNRNLECGQTQTNQANSASPACMEISAKSSDSVGHVLQYTSIQAVSMVGNDEVQCVTDSSNSGNTCMKASLQGSSLVQFFGCTHGLGCSVAEPAW